MQTVVLWSVLLERKRWKDFYFCSWGSRLVLKSQLPLRGGVVAGPPADRTWDNYLSSTEIQKYMESKTGDVKYLVFSLPQSPVK